MLRTTRVSLHTARFLLRPTLRIPTSTSRHKGKRSISTVGGNVSGHKVFKSLIDSKPSFKITTPIRVIQTPRDFYQELISGIRTAKERIYLSSLYIGSSEKELAKELLNALERNSSLRVCILIDALRGTRTDKQGESSARLLEPLVRRYGARARVALYHTPALNGGNKRMWPQRYNETFGLQHIKLYSFDNRVIISGANLSRDYFTNRQDRYMVLEDKPLSDYFAQLVEAISRVSFSLRERAKLAMSGCPDPSRSPREFVCEANKVISEFIETQTARSQARNVERYSERDTVVVPTLQMSQLGIRQDEEHMEEFFRIIDSFVSERPGRTCRSLMTSAYFNFADLHQSHVLKSRSQWDLLVASPRANGFYTASGISKYIPDMYSIIERNFLRSVNGAGRSDITLEEYFREGWTYHGKGVWCYLDDRLPHLTMIGSSNYGYRSIYCDLEAQITLFPGSEAMKADVHNEALQLLSYSQIVDENKLRERIRGAPLWLYLLKPFILKKM